MPSIKRPQNAWIFFRLDMHKLLRSQDPKAKQSVLSKQISHLWRSASPEVKAEYHHRAKVAKEAHLMQYPGYKFCPRRKGESKRLAKESRRNARNAQRLRIENSHTLLLCPTCADLGQSAPVSDARLSSDSSCSKSSFTANLPSLSGSRASLSAWPSALDQPDAPSLEPWFPDTNFSVRRSICFSSLH
jgi:hypothetical protein